MAIGVGERTSPAGAESFARSVFADNIAHTVLAVPITQTRASMHLDTVCTMVDHDAVVMYPAIQHSLTAYTLRPLGDTIERTDTLASPVAASDASGNLEVAGRISVDGPRPFFEAAAEAMGISRLRAIDTGLDPVTAEREQWEDGNNTFALAPGVVVAYERNMETNTRLEEAGIEVLRISGSELGSGRGGPRCMSCPIVRGPLG